MDVKSVLPRDAIPSIDTPEFAAGYFGDPSDDVVVVKATPPRAYPIRILSYHEIVNDVVTIDGESVPVAVTWCPICWSAAVYDRRVAKDDAAPTSSHSAVSPPNGHTLEFGVSGKLADDALVMYDRETGSEWKQPTGQAFDGDLAGARLDVLPSAIMSFQRFSDEYSNGVVLQPVRGSDGSSGPSPRAQYDMEPYEQYADGDAFGLYGMRGEGERRSWDRDDIRPKAVVLGVEAEGDAVGYPVERVEAAGGVVTDSVGGQEIVVVASGDGIHAYENPGYDFETVDGELVADGVRWDAVTGRATDGRQLERVSARLLFAFAWQDAHGADAFY